MIKVSRVCNTAALIFALLLITILVGSNTACKRYDNVTYEVTGDAESVDVMVTNDNGGTEQYNDVPLPWRMDYGGYDDSYVYLYAYNRSESGAVHLSIYVNGQLFKTSNCSGPYCNAVVTGDK